MTLLEAIRCRIHYCRGGAHCPECEAEKPVPRRKYCVKYVGGRHRIEYAQAAPVKQVGGRTVSSRSKTGDSKCLAVEYETRHKEIMDQIARIEREREKLGAKKRA